ncbi:MAG: hypothetical protein JW787_01780 [Sedimentisphaerales bacterium]|nr:hypothetical protein [Sedimentisphaerales bacterium]
MRKTSFTCHGTSLSGIIGIAALIIISIIFTSAGAAEKQISAVINAGKTGEPISNKIYGQFLEHIGGIVTSNLWAEMLNDRKFYNVIQPQQTGGSRRGMGARGGMGGGRFGGGASWTIIGPNDCVTMDKVNPYVGDHTPLVMLNGAEKRGISQAGLSVTKGKSYTGRVVLAGDSRAKVTVSLAWGEEAGNRQNTAIRRIGPNYYTIQLKFTARADSTNARLEITGTGTGSFHIGAVSLMPADNIYGFKPEPVETLKSLRSGVYRFPGGNFVSAHEWRYAIGNPDKRPPVWDPVWSSIQQNDVGTDEFLTLCRLLEVEPYITVNAGYGDAWSAAEYVEYCNGDETTPMGSRRAINGHSEPYNVKLWGIGNEMFGIWQNGVMPQKQYWIKHNLFAKAMKKVDPNITILCSGAMPDHMTGSELLKMYTGRVYPEYLGKWDWTGGLLKNCLDNIDMISEHYYAYSNQIFDFNEGDRVRVQNQPQIEWARQCAMYVRAKYEHYQKYLELIPEFKANPRPVSISEWAYTGAQTDSQNAVLAYSWAIQEMFRHPDVFKMATYTFATSLLNADGTGLNASRKMFKFYRDHFSSIPVEVSGDSPQPKQEYHPGEGIYPKVNPGSDTYPLDVVAVFSDDKKTLTIAVSAMSVNIYELPISELLLLYQWSIASRSSLPLDAASRLL